MNESQVKKLSQSHREKELQKIEKQRLQDLNRREFSQEMQHLLKRLDENIFRTPSGETRNILTDCAIVVRMITSGQIAFTSTE